MLKTDKIGISKEILVWAKTYICLEWTIHKDIEGAYGNYILAVNPCKHFAPKHLRRYCVALVLCFTHVTHEHDFYFRKAARFLTKGTLHSSCFPRGILFSQPSTSRCFFLKFPACPHFPWAFVWSISFSLNEAGLLLSFPMTGQQLIKPF